MKNKISITVEVPLIEEKYDVLIPIDKKIKDVIKSLISGISDLSRDFFPKNKNINLYNKKTGDKYNSESIVNDTDLRNGSCVILI